MTESKLDKDPIAPHNDVVTAGRSNKPLIIAIATAVILAIALFGSVAALMVKNNTQNSTTTNRMSDRTGVMRPDSQADTRAGGRQGAMGMREGNGAAMADSSTRVNGVVTAINGDTLTVSGNGKQVTVQKTSSTTINGTNSSVAVNDTISATGTTTDNTFNATSITIRNIVTN